MGKFTGTLTTSAAFRAKVYEFKLKSKLKKTISPYVEEICQLIDRYHGIPKFRVMQRQEILMEITAACSRVAGPGMADRNDPPHVKVIKNLGYFCIGKIQREQSRAEAIEKELNTPTGRRGLKGTFKYEKLNKPGLPGMRGDDLVEVEEEFKEMYLSLIQEYGIKLTGLEGQDFYMLKKLIKEARGRQNAGVTGWGLVYMNEDQRSRYKLTFTTNAVLRRDEPYTTASGNENIYAANPAGQIFAAGNVIARNEFTKIYQEMGFEISTATMHHSSFLSGADVLCAGTLEVDKGQLLYISNFSGHYKPDIFDLQAVCNAILDSGYVPSSDCFAMFMDIDAKIFPALRRVNPGGDDAVGNTFHFPFAEFARDGNMIRNPAAYAQFPLAMPAAAPPAAVAASTWVVGHRTGTTTRPLLRGAKGKGKI